ncbi:DUF4861 family protein [Chryseobacterium wanjuense]
MIINKKQILLFLCAIDCILSADLLSAQTSIKVKNTLDFSRNEMIAIPVSELKSFLNKNKESDLRIKDSGNKYLPIQWIDYDGDGKGEELLFLANIDAKRTNIYTIISEAKTKIPEMKVSTYSRLVPERADDYTWENDKVAFRVYGRKGRRRLWQELKAVPFPAVLIFG